MITSYTLTCDHLNYFKHLTPMLGKMLNQELNHPTIYRIFAKQFFRPVIFNKFAGKRCVCAYPTAPLKMYRTLTLFFFWRESAKNYISPFKELLCFFRCNFLYLYLATENSECIFCAI